VPPTALLILIDEQAAFSLLIDATAALLLLVCSADSNLSPHWCRKKHYFALMVQQTPLYWCKLHILILHLIGAADSTPNPNWCNSQYSSSLLVK
jgi:hypothetical protein